MASQGIIDEFEQQLKNDYENWSIILEAMDALRRLPQMQESKDFQILNFHLAKVENTTQYLQYLQVINPRNQFSQNRSLGGTKRKIKEDSIEDLDEIKDIMPIRCDKENALEYAITPIFKKKKPVLTDEQVALILNLPVPARPILKDSQQQQLSISPTPQFQIEAEATGPYEVMT
ncbi:Oidioi.mRNA.OKI2018_I69.XSR.g14027.t1.cds [Oikopleura dioica]|uniref:Oidioi.mRNA.OKI2018_I69.XSR.g14027.t1.cds n=1 Tax=Oikopleura dioica TaxID=34765 RepID=A0ABN7SDG1_OIKDI|nr:Oidioi.mRNA.OKI2018_I69.XSR.g14027.t1.cds [Oikopleura dioica]